MRLVVIEHTGKRTAKRREGVKPGVWLGRFLLSGAAAAVLVVLGALSPADQAATPGPNPIKVNAQQYERMTGAGLVAVSGDRER